MTRLTRPPVHLSPSSPGLLERPTLYGNPVDISSTPDSALDLETLPDFLTHSDSEPYRYCLNTSTLRGHKLSLPELVDIAAGAGFEAIEPWIDEIEKFIAEGGDMGGLRMRIQDLGLSVEGGIGFFQWIVDDEDIRAKGLEDARYAMSLLSRLGGKRIAAPPFGAHTPDAPSISLTAAAERYYDLMRLSEDSGVIAQVEIWGASKNLSRLSEAMMVAIDSGHPDANILMDVYHLYKGGSPRGGICLLNASALKLIHVNDYPAISAEEIGDKDRVFPGDGVAPLVPILRDLRKIGFTGILSLELFNPEYYAQEPLQIARTGLEKLREVVQKSFD